MQPEDTMIVESPSAGGEWNRKHLLDIDTFSKSEFELVMKTTDAMKEILCRPIKKVPALRGKTVATLFYEPSTRTRGSFELAAKNLSADVVNFSAPSSSITKGESLIGTLHTLDAMGADMIIMRHSLSGAPYLAAQHSKASIINAGDGWHAHPTQAILDMYTIIKHKKSLKGLKIVIVGDSRYSRVARSNIWGLTRSGAQVTLCGPLTLLPPGINQRFAGNPPVTIETNIDIALDGADVVMVLRLQKERQQSGLLPDIREYVNNYQLNSQRLKHARADVILMHPGPVNEDIEIDADIVHSSYSTIDEQVTNGLAVRMALIYLISGGNYA